MEKPESRRTQMTKRLIRTALVELMEEKTLERITIKELCERADVNRTTFYLHYSDQRSVLNDLKEEVCRQTIAMIGEEDKTEAIIKLLQKHGILEMGRTGILALERGAFTLDEDTKVRSEFNYGKYVR